MFRRLSIVMVGSEKHGMYRGRREGSESWFFCCMSRGIPPWRSCAEVTTSG